ncbi:hypothetical protein V8J36_18860 [Frigidibacter sp. MR17.14]|uniref:hypothetical protein n=1 Tax=Frigidibacter sp. MR17.14 TaxID=3126509 RepID=UPI00301319D6
MTSFLCASALCTIEADTLDLAIVDRIAALLGTSLAPDSIREIETHEEPDLPKFVVLGLFSPLQENCTLVVCADIEDRIVRGRLVPDALVAAARKAWWQEDVDYCACSSQLDMRLAWRLGVMPVPSYDDIADHSPLAFCDAA